MKRIACVSTVLAVLVAAALNSGSRAGAEDASPSIKDIMVKLHKGASSPLAVLKKELRSDSPDWKKVQSKSKDFVILGASLAKTEASKGDPQSYKTLATNYYDNSKALDDAAAKEDKTAANVAFSKLSSSCQACHKAHRGK